MRNVSAKQINNLQLSKNKSGSNIDPWRWPQITFPGSKNVLSKLTLKVETEPEINHIFFKIKPVQFPDWKPLAILSANNYKQEFVENNVQNWCTNDYLFHKLRDFFYVRVTSYFLLHGIRVNFYVTNYLFRELGVYCRLCKVSQLYPRYISMTCSLRNKGFLTSYSSAIYYSV